MKHRQHFRALARSGTIVAVVVMIAGGVSFAALQSQPVKLTGNTIETATASLALSTDDINFSSSHVGFDFNSLIPGATSSAQSYKLYLRNNGGAPLALKFSVTSVPLNPNNINLSQVHVILTPDSSHQPESFTLQDLISANSSGGVAITDPTQLNYGNTAGFSIEVLMDGEAFSGSSASLSNIDFAFSGLALTS